MTKVQTCDDQGEWDDYIVDNEGHPLQLWGWGEVKVAHGWRAERVFVHGDGNETIGAAQLLVKPLPLPFKALVYVPRGPVASEGNRAVVLEAIARHAKLVYSPVAITVEPDWQHMPETDGWKPATNTILTPRTLILDLTKSEDELQAVMSKKTRQYIRKSAGEVTIKRLKTPAQIDECLAIYRQTADRAGFPIHGDDYYHDIFEKLGDHSPVFAAFSESTMVAFLWPVIGGSTLFELYGGMNDDGQRLRANYALKWHVIQTMKEWGIERYDMNGLLNDGISTFKQSFADHEDMLAGTYDKPLSPLYVAWTKGLPLAKKVVRKLKKLR